MSRLWPDRRRVALKPDAVAVTASGGFGRGAVLGDVFVCDPQPGAAAWRACVDTLSAKLDWRPRHTAVSIVLSNHFCQFALLEKPPAITGDIEALAYARHRMQALYGEAAREWTIDLRPNSRNAWLVCCTPQGLLDAIREAFASKRARVASIQPYFSAAWNRRAAEIRGRSGWFVVHEAKRLVAGLVTGGRWVHLVARRTGDTLEDVLDVLDRERELLGSHGAERNVWLYGSVIPQVPAQCREYILSVVAPPREGRVEIAKRPLHAMAA